MLKCSLFTRALAAKRQQDVDWTYIKTTEDNYKNGQVKQPCCSQYKGEKKKLLGSTILTTLFCISHHQQCVHHK